MGKHHDTDALTSGAGHFLDNEVETIVSALQMYGRYDIARRIAAIVQEGNGVTMVESLGVQVEWPGETRAHVCPFCYTIFESADELARKHDCAGTVSAYLESHPVESQ